MAGVSSGAWRHVGRWTQSNPPGQHPGICISTTDSVVLRWGGKSAELSLLLALVNFSSLAPSQKKPIAFKFWFNLRTFRCIFTWIHKTAQLHRMLPVLVSHPCCLSNFLQISFLFYLDIIIFWSASFLGTPTSMSETVTTSPKLNGATSSSARPIDQFVLSFVMTAAVIDKASGWAA